MNFHVPTIVADRHAEDACRDLWGEVLNQNLRDAMLSPAKYTTRSNTTGTTHLDSVTAIRWIGSSEFRLVCDYAGWDPSFIEHHARRLLRAPMGERRLFLARLKHAGYIRRGDPDKAEPRGGKA